LSGGYNLFKGSTPAFIPKGHKETKMTELNIKTPEIHPTSFVAPTAVIHGDVEVDALAVIMFGTIIRAELDVVRVGRETNIQDNCVLHVDKGFPALLGSRVTVGHAAVVHGAKIGNHCLVGIGARALNGSEMGEGSWLAAGSILTEGRTIPAWTLAMGIPAKPIRELTEAEIAYQSEGVDHYVQFGAAYGKLLG
jgi:carbonic anhydrase/acetyltransferase-like protein (isoleucine patch superfamily)